MKRFMYIFLVILVALLMASFVVLSQSRFGKHPKEARLERIRLSPNYKDGEFQNQSLTPTFTGEESKLKMMSDFFFKKKIRVNPVDSIPSVKTNLKELAPDKDMLVWFGHSSYFMQIDGKKILVDPVFSGHASPFSWMINAFAGSNQYSAADMPDIDYLFITHDHWDHLDFKTLKALKPRIKKVICGLGVGAHLENWGFEPSTIIELDWYDQHSLDPDWTVHATPARHFSGRSLKRNRTLWVSFALQTTSMKIFIGGDGGYDKHFAEIGNRFGPFDLAILEQGQYNEKWKYIHLLPTEVFKAAADLNAKRLMPVHNSKFALSVHAWDEPLIELIENSKNYDIQLVTPLIGEKVDLKDTTRVYSQWWIGLK
jgi:L-ascorbate metabolism protein UlaG (beta-lactamase superfamily)